MELTDELKTVFIEAARSLKRFAHRRFQTQTVKALGEGGQHPAERELGRNRQTTHAHVRGLECIAAISTRCRTQAEEHLPHLRDDIKALIDCQSQTAP